MGSRDIPGSLYLSCLCVQEGDSTIRNPSFPLRSPQSGCSPAGSEGTPKSEYTKREEEALQGIHPTFPFFIYLIFFHNLGCN